jgi:hypothetical protein
MVSRPTSENFSNDAEYANAKKIWEKNWKLYEENGFHVDAEGIVRDPEGHFFFSDYDLLAVLDQNGNRRSFGSDGDQISKVKELLRPLNEAVGAPLFRHDGYFEKEYFDELVAGTRPTIILSPNGKAWARPASAVPKLIEELRKSSKK